MTRMFDNCPVCGRRIKDTDKAGGEDANGQRWCVHHFVAALTDRLADVRSGGNELNRTHSVAGDLRIVKCPTCGKDKWAYMGDDLPEEPPCFDCEDQAQRAFGDEDAAAAVFDNLNRKVKA